MLFILTFNELSKMRTFVELPTIVDPCLCQLLDDPVVTTCDFSHVFLKPDDLDPETQTGDFLMFQDSSVKVSQDKY